jgi:hypothetical protein
MRLTSLSLLGLAALIAASGCSSDKNGNGDDDAGGTKSDTGQNTADSGTPPDAGTPDSGPPPCLRDQDCESGKVCNLAMSPATCVAGTACTGQPDCDRCAALTNATDCGHGFNVTAYCDPSHGNVCVRSLAPCEPCETNEDCGVVHQTLRGTLGAPQCLDYGGGQKFCGRDGTLGCPAGFVRDVASGQCRRTEGCSPMTVVCPAGAQGQQCTSDQICSGETCPNTGGAICSTNDQPGAIGTCIGACRDNSQCTDPAFPICNPQNGICIAGCLKDSCAGGEVCHSDGFCDQPCNDDAVCQMKLGTNAYCNTRPSRPPDRLFKDYRDENSCAPLGCEQAVDCPAAGLVCDKTRSPPACIEGCYTRADCLSGEVCKLPGANGPQPSYTRQECRALSEKTDDTAVGVCCNPGCTDRVLQCDINEWCCAEEMSPYENPATCGQIDGRQAEAGECFKIAPKPTSPFCVACGGMNDPPCNSDDYNGGGANWNAGYNTDPMINGGQPFREQEFCFQVADGLGMCAVSCNPNAPDSGCPRGWDCKPNFPPCLQDADCGVQGLTCEGEDTAAMPPRPGRCLCGMNGTVNIMCGTAYALLGEAVERPRCVAFGAMGQMFCLASYICQPPPVRETPPMSGMYNYPPACLP